MLLLNTCNVRLTKVTTIKLFQLVCFGVCFGSTLYMVHKQFKSYIANEDSSSVSYRKFNDEATDLYPTFSFCFWFNDEKSMYKDENFLGVEGVSNRVLYSNFLTGSLEEEYQEENISKKFSLISFEDVVVPAVDSLCIGRTEGKINSESVSETWKREPNDPSLPNFLVSLNLLPPLSSIFSYFFVFLINKY